MLITIISTFLLTLCQQTIGRLLPINMDHFPIFINEQ